MENIVRKGFVRKHLIGFEKIEMLPLTKEEIKSYKDAKACYISGERILKFTKDKNYRNVRDHCHYTGKYKGVAYSICKLKFRVFLEIPAVFHNGSNYDDHFIIKELAKEFDGQFECLGENKKLQNFFCSKKKRKLQKLRLTKHWNYILQNRIYQLCKIYGEFIIKSCSQSCEKNS